MISQLAQAWLAKLRQWISCNHGISLLEIMVGSSVLIVMGSAFMDMSTSSLKNLKQWNSTVDSLALLDQAISLALFHSNHYIPLEDSASPSDKLNIYYGCYSESGILLKNDDDNITFGMSTVSDIDRDLRTKFIKEVKDTGGLKGETRYELSDFIFSVMKNQDNDSPELCVRTSTLAAKYLIGIYPLSHSYRTLIWVMDIDQKDDQQQTVLSRVIRVSPT